MRLCCLSGDAMGWSGLWHAQKKAEVAALVSEMMCDPYGAVSSSIHETGRLVTLAPWLGGHANRVLFLLHGQHPDGRWGNRDGYGLVPTLSATEALLASLRRWQDGGGHGLDYGMLVAAADSGLRALFGWLGRDRTVLVPDTIAAEVVVPSLVAQVNAHLDTLVAYPVSGLDVWRGSGRLALPSGMDDELLMRLRHSVRNGNAVPTKLLHSLEVIAPGVRGAPFVHPVDGAVGCSPAATAAWLDQHTDHPSVDYLETVQKRGGGPVAGVAPITVFERAWVSDTLVAAGFSLTASHKLISNLRDSVGEFGASAGPGLPPDSDDTAVVLSVLAQLNRPHSPDCLLAYRTDTYFRCFFDERTPSTSTNAHVLQALGRWLAHDVSRHSHWHAMMGDISVWLRDRQEADGYWWDKWHASPYYATACCAIALSRYGHGTAASGLGKAVEWVLETQRHDGSWGRWGGTYEETAYAVQTLLRTRVTPVGDVVERAAARGCVYMQRLTEYRKQRPLWHDKDLYTPYRVVRAEGLAALHLAHANRRIAAMVDCWAGDEPEQEVAR